MKAIVLAAGKGTRLQCHNSHLPKALIEIMGKPLIKYVLDHISFIPKEDICIVVGYKKNMIINALGQSYNFVNQEEQLGTGHAVMVTEDHFKSYNGDILVLYGDMPLISKDTFKNIINAHQKTHAECTLLTATVDSPPAYGRIIRDSYGRIIDIVEQRDCTADQLNINEVNVGVYVFKSNILYESLKQLSNNNSQNEYYLTDVPKILIREGASVQTYSINEIDEIYGVNTPDDLKHCERVLLKQANEKI